MPGAERETDSGRPVTIVFTEVVDPVEQAGAMADADWAQLMTATYAALRASVAAHGGTTVQTLDSGTLATFAQPVAALQAARAGQRAVHELGLALRVGIHTGPIQASDGGVLGIAVHLAARVAGAAEPGEVLVTATVADLVAGSGLVLRDRGLRQLKGFADAWQLLALQEGEPLAGSASAPTITVLAPELVSAPEIAYVGRASELERAVRVWRRAEQGSRSALLISGEPGVGKTRLAHEIARVAAGSGAIVLWGLCEEGVQAPYQPFVQALGHLVRSVPGQALRPMLGAHARELVRLFPDLPDRLPGLAGPTTSEPETERYRLFEAVADALSATANAAAVLLVIDDLHWTDRSSLLLLEHLLTHLTARRLCIVGTFRDSELGRHEALRQTVGNVRRTKGVSQISLQGLDAEGTAALVSAFAGEPLGADGLAFAATVHEESAGNPFFIGELLRHLAETGAVKRGAGGRWTVVASPAARRVPEGIREVVARRLGSLSPDHRAVLNVAALMGSEFSLDLLTQVSADSHLVNALDVAVTARLIDEVQDGVRLSYRFTHALVRATLHDEQSGAQRAVSHARIAAAMQTVHAHRLDAVLPELAAQWTAAAPAGYGRQALSATCRAADAALAALAFDAAEAQYARARELWDSYGGTPAEHVEILLGIAEARYRGGDPRYREVLEQTWQEAILLADPALLRRVAVSCSRGYWSALGFVDTSRLEVLQAALDVTAGGGERARLLAELAAELIWDQAQEPRYNALADEALALARASQDRATLATVLSRRLATLWGLRHIQDRDQVCHEALALATELADPVLQVLCAAYGLISAVESVHPERLDPLLELLERLSPQLGQPIWEYSISYAVMNYYATRGTPALLEQQTHRFLALGTRLGLPEAEFLASCQTGGRHWWRDTYEEVVEDIVPIVESFSFIPTMRTWLAAIYGRLGLTEKAQEILDAVRSDGFALPADHSQGIALAECALAAASVGDAAASRELLALLLPHREVVVVNPINAVGPMSRYIGLLQATCGELADATESFRHAAGVCERLGGRMWLAHLELDWAEALRSTPQESLPHARQAAALARELELPGIARRAEALLSAAG